jgi:hypothetical protein
MIDKKTTASSILGIRGGAAMAAIVTGAWFALGCAGPQTHVQARPDPVEEAAKKNPGAFYAMPFIGTETRNTPAGLTIEKVAPGSSADRAGIQVGDALLTINDVPLESNRQLRKWLCLTCKSGDVVQAKIRRADKILIKPMTLDSVKIRYDQWVLFKDLLNGKTIRLAITTGQVLNTSHTLSPGQLAQWQDSIKLGLIANMETMYIRRFSGESNFQLIDRQHIETTLNELKFQNSGIASDDTSLKLGEALGATHMIIIDFSRFILPSNQIQDKAYEKLVDVQTGRVLSSYQIPLNNNGLVK